MKVRYSGPGWRVMRLLTSLRPHVGSGNLVTPAKTEDGWVESTEAAREGTHASGDGMEGWNDAHYGSESEEQAWRI